MDFNQAEERFKELKAKFEAGALSEDEFKSQLEELMVQDKGGNWWMIGYETERWYRHDGTEWVQADPPYSHSQKSTSVMTPKPETMDSIFTENGDASRQDQRSTKTTAAIVTEETIWRFGKQQIGRGLIGSVVYAILSFIPYSPTTAVLIFFSISFGPWVGLLTALIGQLLPSLFFGYYFGSSSFLFSLIINPLIGLISGSFMRKFEIFRDPREILKAIGLYFLAAVIAILFSSLIYGYTNWGITIGQLIIGSIILTILMITFAKTARPM